MFTNKCQAAAKEHFMNDIIMIITRLHKDMKIEVIICT